MRTSVAATDLAVCGVDPQDSARRSLLWCLCCGAVGAALTSVVLRAPAVVTAGATAGAMAVGLGVEPRTVRRAARRRRQELETSLASYLDLVNVLVAGGAGMETALLAASEAGDGWTFELFREALHDAHRTGAPYWDRLRRVGEQFGVDSLVETATTVRLAGEHGARVRRSLAVRAASLRARQMANLEHAANQTTEHMGLPMVMIFLGFVGLLGYPALVTTLGSL